MHLVHPTACLLQLLISVHVYDSCPELAGEQWQWQHLTGERVQHLRVSYASGSVGVGKAESGAHTVVDVFAVVIVVALVGGDSAWGG